MSDVVVAVGLLVPERLPDVSVVSGERPARPVRVEARSRPWWPWLLLLTGFVGVLLLVALYPRMCERRDVWVPLTAADLDRARAALRRAWWLFAAGAAALVFGVAGLALRTSAPSSSLLALVAVGAAAGVISQVLAARWAVPVRLTLRDGGEQVVLHGVAPAFVEQAERRWA